MKITDEQRLQFAIQYKQCINQLVKWLVEDQNNDIDLMQNFDFKCNHDFEGLAIKMFLQHVKQFYDHHYSLETAVQNVKDILGAK